MTHMPPDIEAMILESARITAAIKILKAKKRLTITDLRQLIELKAEFLRLCPAVRFVWVDGAPVLDILQELQKIEMEKTL